MLKRMVMQTTIFTLLIALAAVSLNGMGILDSRPDFKHHHIASWSHDDD